MKGLSTSTFVTPGRAFQVNGALQKREARCKQRIERRLRRRNWRAQSEPMFRGRNIQYEGSDRVRGLGAGGIGAMHLLAQRTGLAAEIDASLQLLQVHQPYHESDHVLNIAYNILCSGKTLEDLEQLRHDEVYQDAIGARVVPDPTTAGDFTRRFRESDIEALMAAIDRVRVKVWQQQPASFFDEAIVEADGMLAPTNGECKEGMGISYNGVWGYHPLVVTLANTREPLYLVNRSGNRPSHEGAAERFDQAIALCRHAGFRQVLLRGDTDFSSTRHLDRWNEAGVRFVFGIDAMPKLVEMAADLARSAWCSSGASRTSGSRPRMSPSSATNRAPVDSRIGWWWCGRTCRWKRASRCCSTTCATSSTSPTMSRRRPMSWCCWPTIAAIRRT
jgi:hypothetical protein